MGGWWTWWWWLPFPAGRALLVVVLRRIGPLLLQLLGRNHHGQYTLSTYTGSSSSSGSSRMLVVNEYDQNVYDDGCCPGGDDDIASPTMIMRWLVTTATLPRGDSTTASSSSSSSTTADTATSTAANDPNYGGSSAVLVNDTTTSMYDDEDGIGRSMLTKSLIEALRLYVPIWLVGLTIYCIVRRWWPRTFAVRQWVVPIRTKLANDQFGYISWLWRVRTLGSTSGTDEELLHEIGLDALCFLRLIRMGLRLSCIGMFNSLWLIPVYITVAVQSNDPYHHPNNTTGTNTTTTTTATTPIGTVDVASDFSIIALDRHHKNDLYYICTVLASYVFFGYTFYTILLEFRWFVRQRHNWLTQLRPQNYTILVRNIPKHLRSDVTLQEHFNRLYGAHRVLSAHCCLFLHHLEAQVQKRTVCRNHLERAVAEFQHRGKRPTHPLAVVVPRGAVASSRRYKSMEAEAKQVDSIDTYTRELAELDEDIAKRIQMIEQKARPRLLVKGSAFRSFDTYNTNSSSTNTSSIHSGKTGTSRLLSSRSSSLTARRSTSSSLEPTVTAAGNADGGATEATLEASANTITTGTLSPIAESSGPDGGTNGSNNNSNNSHTLTSTSNSMAARANVLWAANRARVNNRHHRTRAKLKAVVRIASTTITGESDGTPDDAGFVTFTSLVAMHGALQMKQHSDLFAMETEVAPEPSEIFWHYVGKHRNVLQTGRLISLVMTLALCLFWTFVVSFIVGLTDPKHLANVLPTRSTPFLDKNLWIGKFLKILSPVLLLIFNSGLLPIILKFVSRFECPASESVLEASAFWKMAAFTVIQTFFVSLISGSVTVTEKIEAVFDDPHEFVGMLARNLPRQDAYFMQLLTVSTCIGTLLELFRVVPLFQATVRMLLLGRNDLTEKQKRQGIGPFKPLCVVDKIYFSRIQARFLLYFMVLFVYSTLSPLVNWFCCIFFLFLGSVYRHQFIFNYPNTPDSGGVMWLMFMAVVLACIVIAQLTLWGFLGIKKAGVAISTMIPLMIMTGLFIVYLIQNFFTLGQYLPAHTGLGQDLDNAEAGVDFEPFRNLYRHPALGLLEEPEDGGGRVAVLTTRTNTTTTTSTVLPSSSSSIPVMMMESSVSSPSPPLRPRPPLSRGA